MKAYREKVQGCAWPWLLHRAHGERQEQELNLKFSGVIGWPLSSALTGQARLNVLSYNHRHRSSVPTFPQSSFLLITSLPPLRHNSLILAYSALLDMDQFYRVNQISNSSQERQGRAHHPGFSNRGKGSSSLSVCRISGS